MYPSAYMDYLVHFHGDRDFFECHELLEEYWKEEGMKQIVWVGLIQLAVGLYHHRRKNFVGARKMLESTLQKLQRSDVERLGLDYNELVEIIRARLTMIERGEQYVDVNLPIADKELLSSCQAVCKMRGWTWRSVSDLNNEEIVHRHTRRNRSDVILERYKQWRSKQMNSFASIRNIYCIGRNYAMHAKELGNEVPNEPLIFSKPTHALHPASGELYLDPSYGEIHYEVELVVELARSYDPSLPLSEIIRGIAIGIDFTQRDRQAVLKQKGNPWLLSKGFKGSAVLSPFQLFISEEDFTSIQFTLTKNGTIVQQGNPQQMLFDLSAILAYLDSQLGTGEGDIIYTGTPAGVGPVIDGDVLTLSWYRQSNPDVRFEYGPLRIVATTKM